MNDLGIANKLSGIYFGQLRGHCFHSSEDFKEVIYVRLMEVLKTLSDLLETNVTSLHWEFMEKNEIETCG